MSDIDAVYGHLETVRAQCPLVHSITNFVVMNNTANALLAVGASPIMAHAPEEMNEMVGIVGALVLNIGTLSKPWVESMIMAGRDANERPIPVVLDPVGAGASTLRTQAALDIMNECKPTIVRGNAFEVLTVASAIGAANKQRVASALAAEGCASRGVDSAHSGEGVADIAQDLARQANCTVIISGPVDTIASATSVAEITGGHELMPKVTGMGCTATALCGAFAAVVDDPFEAGVAAIAVMSAAGHVAAAKSDGPGTLQLHFYDALFNLTREQLEAAVSVERR